MDQLNIIISEINVASKANDGALLSQLEVKLSTYIPTLVEELTQARHNRINAKVKFLDQRDESNKKLSVAEANIRAEAETGGQEDNLKDLVESSNVIINSIKDQLKIWLFERNLNQGI